MVIMRDDAKKMAQLLRSGNTMLNQACPVCNNPIFRNKNGKPFCPICNREIIFVDGNVEKKVKDKEKVTVLPKEKDLFNSLRLVILEKIEWITQKLKNETQIDVIERYNSLIAKSLEILKSIE